MKSKTFTTLIFLSLFLQGLVYGFDIYDPNSLEEVYEIAVQCPEDGGDAVYRARALYSNLTQQPIPDIPCADDRDSEKLGGDKNQNILEDLLIYPNPANEYATVQLTTELPAQVVLMDLSGKVILRQEFIQQTRLNLKALSPGIYLIKVNSDSNTLFGKIVKQ